MSPSLSQSGLPLGLTSGTAGTQPRLKCPPEFLIRDPKFNHGLLIANGKPVCPGSQAKGFQGPLPPSSSCPPCPICSRPCTSGHIEHLAPSSRPYGTALGQTIISSCPIVAPTSFMLPLSLLTWPERSFQNISHLFILCPDCLVPFEPPRIKPAGTIFFLRTFP